MTREEVLKDFARFINPSRVRVLKSAGLDLVEGRREGPYVWDLEGRKYIDCMTGAGCFNVGRRNPKLIQALKGALDEYDHGGFLFMSEPKVKLARKLWEISPGKKLNSIMYGVGGGEVNDFAIKLARGYTMKSKVISTEKAYHGHTGFSLSAIGREAYRKPFLPLMPGFEFVPYGDLGAMTRAIDSDTACVILEPVQGEGGVFIPPEEYFPGVRKLCDEKGVLLIVDEIQTGFGRTGKMFCVENYGIIPDIMTIGKSLGGGLYPITAALYREELHDFIFANPFIHFSTFGGSDLGCVVACETIDFIQENRLCEHAARMGEIMEKGYRSLMEKYPTVLETFRRKGLMMGLQYRSESFGPRMSAELAKNGVIAVFSGNDPRVMRIMPSLMIQEADARTILEALDKSMGIIAAAGSK